MGSFGMSEGPSFGSFTFDENKIRQSEMPGQMPNPGMPNPGMPGEVPGQTINSGMPQGGMGNPMMQGQMNGAGMQPGVQPQMSQPMGQPMGQPMMQPQMQNPMGYGYPIQDYGGAAPQNGNTKKIVIIVGVVFALMIGAMALIAIMMFNKPQPEPQPEPEPEPEVVDYEANVPTIIDVRRFCLTNGLFVHNLEEEDSEDIYKSLHCRSYEPFDEVETDILEKTLEEPEGDFATLDYYIFNKDHNQLSSMIKLDGDYSELGTELENTEEYKIFYNFNYDYNYTLVSYNTFYKNAYLVISAKNAEAIETALTTIGLPETEHEVPTEESEAKKREEEKEQASSTPAKRDVIRRNDMARLSTSLVQYQTNNAGNLPGASIWTATMDFSDKNACKDDNTACNFIHAYMNASGEKNDYLDPSGDPYNLVITSNLAADADGTIGNATFNENSKLSSHSKAYTINGKSPFGEHVIYVVPGGTCDGQNVKQSTSKRHFSILYKLEEGQTYCLSEQ